MLWGCEKKMAFAGAIMLVVELFGLYFMLHGFNLMMRTAYLNHVLLPSDLSMVGTTGVFCVLGSLGMMLFVILWYNRVRMDANRPN